MIFLWNISLLALLLGCVTPSQETVSGDGSKSNPNAAVEIREKPIQPAQGITKSDANDVETFILARNLIEMRTVKRISADLRIGPGVEFNLADEVLNHGETVVVLERSAQWLKVATTDAKKLGWVHKLALGDQKIRSSESVHLDSKIFPTVFAATRVQHVYSYSKKEKIQIDISRGVACKMLREENGKKLLWLSQLNLLFWVDSGTFL